MDDVTISITGEASIVLAASVRLCVCLFVCRTETEKLLIRNWHNW